MPATKELVGYNRSVEEIKTYINADELIYQDLEDLKCAASIGNPKVTNLKTPFLQENTVLEI